MLQFVWDTRFLLFRYESQLGVVHVTGRFLTTNSVTG